jgi:hypothetical protein
MSINFIELGAMGTASNVDKVKEHNESRAYYMMRNKKGREVPVGVHVLQDALKRGYTHIDNIQRSDDPALQVNAVMRDPNQSLVDMATKMAEVVEMMADPEAVAEIKAKRTRKKAIES